MYKFLDAFYVLEYNWLFYQIWMGKDLNTVNYL